MKNVRFQIHIGWRQEWEEKLTNYIKEKVKEAREEQNLSQRELSRIIERSNAYIQQIESGRLDASILDLVGLSLALKKPIKYFLPLYEKDEDELGAREWELLDHFRKIQDGEMQDLAVKQVAQLARTEKAMGKK